jgi:uncharacterized protein YdhG (YjbR/CyaY superfamily)
MQSSAITLDAYLAELPEERRLAIEVVRRVILEHLPQGYEEAINWGMVAYQVPLEVYPGTYNKKPLLYAALASQKHHMAIYLTSIYLDDVAQQAFEAAYRATGKRYDAGKSCVRFRKLDDLPLEFIGRAVASVPMKTFIRRVKEIRAREA